MPLALLVFLFAFRPASAGDTYLSDLTAVSATSGWSTVQKDKCINTNPINLGGKVYAKGLGTHAPSEMVYNLGGKYAAFSAVVGIDDGTQGKGSSEFLVYADDSLLFKSGVLKGQMTPAKIAVNVTGRNKLKLVTTIGPDTYDMDDADWADAQLAEKPTVRLLPQNGLSARTQAQARPDGTSGVLTVDALGVLHSGSPGRNHGGSGRPGLSLSDIGVRWTTAIRPSVPKAVTR